MLLEQLGRIDLNLLIILQVLLEERNGSRAARRLHLSQSAVSKALGRLRETFDDPLFVRSAYGLDPTPRALDLQQQLQPILLSLDNLIQPPAFDPASTEREFVIASMDSAFTLFAPLYLSELKRQAPGIRLRYEEWTEHSLTEMSQGQVDIAFTVRENCINSDFRLDTLPNAICQRLLAIDDLTCLVQRDHPALREPEWDLPRYLAYPHVQTYCEGRDRWMLDHKLAEQDLYRRIEATVPSFEAALRMGMHSDMIVTLSRLYARHATQVYPLVPLPLPIALDSISHLFIWHQRHEEDPGHRWLRETLLTLIMGKLETPGDPSRQDEALAVMDAQ
ncbi:LysR substrate-binding domain-containing protein [Aeromonas media]|uniref:LysR substrate-binding domain-containing protein n=1 Tax=Aeromonas media TaxID=651 RepID=UPI00192173C3|nr:LysR substrate-binding domain-containing protein [Aeromonas media]MBL0514839.1 LysR family transcriptional regulator [Aeromonas media]